MTEVPLFFSLQLCFSHSKPFIIIQVSVTLPLSQSLSSNTSLEPTTFWELHQPNFKKPKMPDHKVGIPQMCRKQNKMTILFLLVTSFLAQAGAQSTPEILRMMYRDAGGYDWYDSRGWDDNEDNYFCQWHGIECYDAYEGEQLYGQIETIDLTDNHLVGSLNENIFEIPYLSQLLLRDNADLEISLKNIEQADYLTKLALSGTEITSFEGLDQASTTLEDLHITSCSLRGAIPWQIFQLTELRSVYANSNYFDSEIPREIGNLRRLEKFYLFDNALTGTIPDDIEKLASLTSLVLSNNKLTGELPLQAFNELEDLQLLALSGNSLGGEIPDFDNLYQITGLHLDNNLFTGEIPADFLWSAPRDQTVTVDLRNNNLSGIFRSNRFAAFSQLNIYASGNKFTSIDENLCNNGDWLRGNVYEYGCDGILCPIGTFAPDGRQDGDDYCMDCPIAEFMGATDCGASSQEAILTKLYNNLDGDNWEQNYNWLTEDVCEWEGISCDEIGDIYAVELPSNSLSGSVPGEIFGLPFLETLNLSSNKIEFDFNGIFIAENLRELNLGSTGLSSLDGIEELEGTSIQSLILSNNNLDGQIPDDIFFLEDLQHFHVSFVMKLIIALSEPCLSRVYAFPFRFHTIVSQAVFQAMLDSLQTSRLFTHTAINLVEKFLPSLDI